MVHANTLFQYVSYNMQESQFISAGTDRKIAYWEVFDGALIRELEGSQSGSINGLDISADGHYFVSGGDDKLLKVTVCCVLTQRNMVGDDSRSW